MTRATFAGIIRYNNMGNIQRDRIDLAVQDKAIADLHAQGLFQKDIAQKLGIAQPTVSVSLKRTRGRDLRDAALSNRDHRAELFTKYEKAEEDIKHLLFKLRADLDRCPNTLQVLRGLEQFGRLYDRLFKIHSQVADLFGLKSLTLKQEHDLSPNMLRAVELMNASNGDRAQQAREIRQLVAGPN